MLNTIFRKQFFVYMGSLIISFVLLGLVLSQAFQSYFTNQKEKVLIEQGAKIIKLYEQAYKIGFMDMRTINDEVQILHKYLDASFIFVDKDFEIKMASKDISESIGKILSVPELRNVMDGEIITTQGKLGDIFSEAVLSVGYPVKMNKTVVGAIFMNSSIPELQKSIHDVFRISLLCLLISGTIAFILIYISSKTISRPLHEMNEAAKIIASGDFEKRISVKSKDEVGQLANSFNYMAESLDLQEKQRREFIANISHDLRSPLTSMSGFLQAILDGTIPIENQNRYVKIILDETERLAKLANDILDISKIQIMNTELNKTKFDLNELIRKTIIQFEKRIIDKNIEMVVKFADERNIVYADSEKIQRVVYNLLDNAVKFSRDGGNIKIETTTREGKVFVSVKDEGIGISKCDQKRIYERFFKADTSRGMDKKGSGLGLSIIKEFIKAHDETINIISEEGKGCEFIFSLQEINENI